MMGKKEFVRETFEDRATWLNARGIGGSSASAIMGLNPYSTEIDVYNNFVHGKNVDDSKHTESQEYGTLCEPLIRQMVILDFPNWEVHEPDGYEMFRRKDKPYMTATLDGWAVNKETKEKIVIEIKTHDWRKGDEKDWDGTLPANYFIQVCHYLAVRRDMDGALLVAKLRYFDYSHGKKVSKQEIRYYWLWRSDKAIADTIEMIEKKETDFYVNHIEKRIPPKISIKF